METRKRTSKTQKIPSHLERTSLRNAILTQLLNGELSQGKALRKLRVEILGLNQEQYSQLVKVSRITLSEIENDKGNYSVATLNQVFRPMGLEIGVVPIVKALLNELIG